MPAAGCCCHCPLHCRVIGLPTHFARPLFPAPLPTPPPLQAEETAAKLRELETDMLLRRQEHRSGVSCGCLVISWSKDHLPDHLRVWEMTLT